MDDCVVCDVGDCSNAVEELKHGEHRGHGELVMTSNLDSPQSTVVKLCCIHAKRKTVR